MIQTTRGLCSIFVPLTLSLSLSSPSCPPCQSLRITFPSPAAPAVPPIIMYQVPVLDCPALAGSEDAHRFPPDSALLNQLAHSSRALRYRSSTSASSPSVVTSTRTCLTAHHHRTFYSSRAASESAKDDTTPADRATMGEPTWARLHKPSQ